MKTKFLLPLLIISFILFPLGAQCQVQKKQVAIYVARGDGDQKMVSYAKFFASELQLAVSRSAKYNAVERTGKFLELLSREQSYQRTGQVDESKIAELGKHEGVNFVLSVDMTDFGNNSIYVVWKLIDVETAVVQDGDSEIKEIVNMVADLKSFSEALTKRITGGGMSTSGSSRYSSSTQTNYGTVSGTNYTETAFGINMQMVWVEGCTSKQLDGYYIGKFEVTQGQWAKVMGSNPSSFKKGDNYPVENVSWEDATAFCEELSRRTGKKYCLPTREQWRYAERDGNRNSDSKYSGSSSVDVVAWYNGNSGGSTHPVGTKRDNLLGIYDMNGNVSEWCRDYESGSKYRPYFGGDWTKSAGLCTLGFDSPFYDRSSHVGFRVVCEP